MNAPAGPVLRDIHLPPEPGWWPPAPGWWLLAALLVAAIALGVVKFHRIRRRRRRRRAALRELDHCISSAGDDPVRLAAELSRFLRRIAVRENPSAAAWDGQRWLAYLDARSDSEEFGRGIGRILVDAPYRRCAEYDTAALIALVRRWTREALDGGVLDV